MSLGSNTLFSLFNEAKMASYKHPEMLVSTEWLASHLDDPSIRIVDARWRGDGSGYQHYLAGHIPGAVTITEDELPERIDEFSPSDWIITYCT